jgi:hypothetical protein
MVDEIIRQGVWTLRARCRPAWCRRCWHPGTKVRYAMP